MTSKRILISGASGSTGRYAVEEGLAQGLKVRALVHQEDARSAALKAAGAEVVIGDLLQLNDVRSAMEGVSAAYFVYPIQPHLLEASAYFIQAASEAGVRAIVNMSQATARSDSNSNAARDHWVAERLFDRSGIPVTHLRPVFFAQNFIHPLFVSAIIERGTLRLPFGNGRHAPIAAEDQARVIATILANPEPHEGRTYRLHGPIEADFFGLVEIVSDVLGRQVRYEPVPVEAWKENNRLPPFFLQHLCAIAPDYANGMLEGVDTIIEQLTKQPPMTFEAFIRKHIGAFGLQPPKAA